MHRYKVYMDRDTHIYIQVYKWQGSPFGRNWTIEKVSRQITAKRKKKKVSVKLVKKETSNGIYCNKGNVQGIIFAILTSPVEKEVLQTL